ncbi:MFS transporter, SP family, sugar:H+ symporter [Purpureocillium lilacinum]|uniref:MFS transporter, SP family, sugar:H+ symporter n=1 Tax=Purpureocillium lilacinum TaxID=33203 RepID=A0A179HLN1_PURLI|nr:MFS transporter, SP family, sugar:H+ symporter [Purpureocillium lilacinum]OAQ90461.1 MFS transporter, SP family, sugar:H+ symporter [Purpureocillium lilacinum]
MAADQLGPATAWWRDPGLRTLYLLLPIVILSSSYQGFDGMIMNGLQLLPSWQKEFNHPTGPILGLLNSIQSVGAIVALPLVGWLVDRIGRRASIAFGAAWTLVGAILQGSAKHVAPFIIARFLIGWGLAFTVVGAPLLLAELALPKHRGTVLSYFPTAWYIGAIIAAWTTYGTQHIENSWSWRTPSILQGVPAVIQLLLIWLVPESPRWLISKGSGAKARQILVKYHANGDEQSPIVDIEYSQIKEAILQDTRVKKEGSYLDLISGNGLVQYYLHSVLNSIGITETVQQTTINGCLSIYNFVLAMVASLLVEKVGRRRLFLISTTGMLVAFILWTSFAALYTTHKTNNYAIGVLVSIFLSNGAYDLGWTPLWAYPAELLPFETRARGVAYMTGVMHIWGFFSTFVNPIGLQNIGWKYYIVYIVYTLIELLAVWQFFVETRGYTLEEIT